jgi:hypothetical protein
MQGSKLEGEAPTKDLVQERKCSMQQVLSFEQIRDVVFCDAAWKLET